MPAFIALILNLPWTIIGLICGIISIPQRVKFSSKPEAIIFYIKSFWWYAWLPNAKGVRGMAIGNIVLLGPKELKGDLEHELIHVSQSMREPLIHPFLYEYENMKRGYRNNKYEKEAYEKAGNIYITARWDFGGDKEFADRLKSLILIGKKTATTGLYTEGKKHSEVGEYDELVGSDGKSFCVIQYTKIEVKPFLNVNFDYAKLEGEGEKSIEEWRKNHREFFLKYYPDFSDDRLVVCCSFNLIEKL